MLGSVCVLMNMIVGTLLICVVVVVVATLLAPTNGAGQLIHLMWILILYPKLKDLGVVKYF